MKPFVTTVLPGLAILLLSAGLCCAQIVEIRTDQNEDPARLEISRRNHQVTLYYGVVPLKTFPVAVGRRGWETPLGEFYVFQMLRDPGWKHPLTGELFPPGDPGNELGHYWIGFAKDGKNYIGFHGTPHPETVGKSMSHGCVRMYDKDISNLFAQVRVGTRVTVVP